MNDAFTWVDLSTFDVPAARRFYHRCFGWDYHDLGEGYLACGPGGANTAGLYAMPGRFQRMGMPSFWMSYIQVSDIEAMTARAVSSGAKLELPPQAAGIGGRFALIRDPAGAGFTCFEGDAPAGFVASDQDGMFAWNELHVSSLERVEAFYQSVFGWQILPAKQDARYDIFANSAAASPIASIKVSSNVEKGDKEYWGVYFSSRNLRDSAKRIEWGGGTVVDRLPLGDLPALLAFDQQGAAFYVVEQ